MVANFRGITEASCVEPWSTRGSRKSKTLCLCDRVDSRCLLGSISGGAVTVSIAGRSQSLFSVTFIS